MKSDFEATIFFDYSYFDLSEKLRIELELAIDKLYAQDRFKVYSNNNVICMENATKSDFLCAYLLSKAPKDYVLLGKLLQGIKTWFNMYYDDRLSVIDKFKTCYQNIAPQKNINEKQIVTITFCKFLISELLQILAESRWQTIAEHSFPD